MPMSRKRRCQIAFLVILSLPAVGVAGELDPPSAPAPTSKPLGEIEPRTAVPSLPFTIDAPGSYYLTASLSGTTGQSGIAIDADGVTLDLAGFSLTGVPGSLDGIVGLASHADLTIRNGTVRGWGGDGIDLALNDRTVVSGVVSAENTGVGIIARNGGIVRDCVAAGNGGGGIVAGEAASVSGCTAFENEGSGIVVGSGSTVADCTARFNTGFQSSGIVADGTGAIIRDCTSSSNGAYGIKVNHATIVTGNQCDDNSSGIQTVGSDNRIENNLTTDNWLFGINTASTGNVIIRNTSSGNGTPYNITPGNFAGTIVTTSAAMNAATNDLINIAF